MMVAVAGIRAVDAGGHRLAESLPGLEFMVASTSSQQTTRHAEVILPPTGLLERPLRPPLPCARGAEYGPLLPAPPQSRSGHDWRSPGT